MSSGLRAELREALALRLEEHVRSVDVPNQQAAFGGGSEVYTIAQLYRFFNVSRDVPTEEDVKAVFDRDFVEIIRLLECSEPGDVRLFQLYPLLRKIIILMEAYLSYVGHNTRFEGTFAHKYSLPEMTLYEVLDSLYEELCGCRLEKKRLLNDLTTMLEGTTSGLDSILLSISGFVNMLVPIIAYSFESEVDNVLENVLATFTFGALQRISALFLLLTVFDQSFSGSSSQSQSREDALLALSGEEVTKENMHRLDFLCKETLDKCLPTKITDHYLAIAWHEDVLYPILHMLHHTFSNIGKIVSRKENLSDVVLATTVGFLSKISDDCNPFDVAISLMLGFGRNLITMFSEGLKTANVALWSHYELQLLHVLKLQQSLPSPRYEQVSSPASSSGEKAGNGIMYRPVSNCAPPSRSLSTLLSATEVQNRFTEFVTFLQYCAQHQEDLLDGLFGIPFCDDLGTVECLSSLIAHFANLVQLGDALVYITQRSPNIGICELVSKAINIIWKILCDFGGRVPFGVIKACFYDLGSEFHMDNLAAQICCFNVATHDFSKLKEAYERNLEMYRACVDMLRVLFHSSSSVCSTCVSYRQNKARRFSNHYLTVSSAFLGRWFVMESIVGDASERQGLLDAFAEWCHSINVEEYMAARFLCRLMTRLCKAEGSFLGRGHYVFDVLLGLCMHCNDDDRDLRSMLRPLNTGRLNTFRCLSIYLENEVFSEWMLYNVVLPYTCVFVRDVVAFTDALVGRACEPSEQTFQCYFVKTSGSCNCMESPLINGPPSACHYLELLSALSWGCYAPTKEDRSSLMVKHILVVLCGMLGKLVQFLHANQECGDKESRFSVFVLAAKLASVLVGSSHFGRKNNQIVLILKLYSLLGNQKVCMPEEVEIYLSLILQALCVFHAIFDEVPVKDQLLKLHNGFIALLLSKISACPGLLLRHDLYKGVPTALIGQLSGYFAKMLRQSRSMSSYLGALYNFKVWNVCLDYALDREDVKLEYVESGLRYQDESPELRIMLNTAFLLFCRLHDLASGGDTRSLAESGSCVGMYCK